MAIKLGGIQLQAVRGLAIMGILIMRTQTFWFDEGLGELGRFADDQGSSCVIAFFMLSGFLFSNKMRIIPELNWSIKIRVCR